MATPHNEGSLLLALPMELIERIAAELGDDHDAILSTHLACKTLEAVIFDCSAETFFASHQYCILYRPSLRRLHALLASSSRLMSRMRTVTFTSCFFANTDLKHVQLALNQSETNLKSAQIAAMKAYSQCQVEMLQTQLLPDAELIRAVLVALRAKCPGVELNLNIEKNAKSCIPVHATVLKIVAVLGTALTGLTVDPTTLSSGELETLPSGLSACASSLVKFSLGKTNVTGAQVESHILASRRLRLLQSLLGSANALRDLSLTLGQHRYRQGMEELTSNLLLPSSHPGLQSLSLCVLSVTERTMLNALVNSGGQLEKVSLHVVRLTDIEGEGWSDVLKSLAVLPKLREIAFYALYIGTDMSPHRFVDLRDLEHGRKTFSRQATRVWKLNNVLFSDDEVAAGLRELLQGGLKYY